MQQNFSYYDGKIYAVTCICGSFVVVCTPENVKNPKQPVCGKMFLRALDTHLGLSAVIIKGI